MEDTCSIALKAGKLKLQGDLSLKNAKMIGDYMNKHMSKIKSVHLDQIKGIDLSMLQYLILTKRSNEDIKITASFPESHYTVIRRSGFEALFTNIDIT